MIQRGTRNAYHNVKDLSRSFHFLIRHTATQSIQHGIICHYMNVLLDFSLTVKAATLIFISGCGSAISSAKEGKSGFIYNLVKN